METGCFDSLQYQQKLNQSCTKSGANQFRHEGSLKLAKSQSILYSKTMAFHSHVPQITTRYNKEHSRWVCFLRFTSIWNLEIQVESHSKQLWRRLGQKSKFSNFGLPFSVRFSKKQLHIKCVFLQKFKQPFELVTPSVQTRGKSMEIGQHLDRRAYWSKQDLSLMHVM